MIKEKELQEMSQPLANEISDQTDTDRTDSESESSETASQMGDEVMESVAPMIDQSKVASIVATIVLIILIVVSAAIIQYLEDAQNWSYLDSVYFVIVTISTIGYGDLAPKTTDGRLFTVVFGLLGISISAFAVVAFANRVVVEIEMFWTRRQISKISTSLRKSLRVSNLFTKSGDSTLSSELSSAQAQLTNSEWTTKEELLLLLPLVIVVLFIGAALFHYNEGWSYPDAMWFCFVTLTTIGYGDLLVKSTGAKVLLIFYALAGLGILSLLLGKLGSWFAEEAERRHAKTQKLINKTLAKRSSKSANLLTTRDKIFHYVDQECAQIDSLADRAWLYQEVFSHVDGLVQGKISPSALSRQSDAESQA